MTDTNFLEKTTRVNLLFDFYESLLTDKQRTFLRLYFHDDLSLGEIAGEFEISRQAVYEHIKRAEKILEEYEDKLRLVNQHERRQRLLIELQEQLKVTAIDTSAAMALLNELFSMDEINE